jgi:HK97 family phage portal protein
MSILEDIGEAFKFYGSFLRREQPREIALPSSLYYYDGGGDLQPVRAGSPLAQWGSHARSSFTNNLFNALHGDITNADDRTLSAAYIQSVTAASCIEINAQLSQQVPVVVTDPDGEPLESERPGDLAHPLGSFTDNATRLLWNISTYQDIWGRAYLRKHRSKHGNFSILELLWPPDVSEDIRTDINGKEHIVAFRVGNETVPPHQIVYLSRFDPNHRNGGLSPMEFVLAQIGVSRGMVVYAANFFFNGAVLSGILQVDDATEEQRKLIGKEFGGQFRGARKSHRVFVINQETKYTPTSAPPEDLAMNDLSQIVNTEIARAFNVHPALVGLSQVGDPLSAQSTFRAIEANQIRGHILPGVEKNLEEINKQWAWVDFDPAKYYTLAADPSKVEALSPVTAENVAHTTALGAAGVLTLNEERERLGLAPYPADNGEVVTINSIMYPVDQIMQAAEQNVFAAPAFGDFGLPIPGELPDAIPGEVAQTPANIESLQSLNGAQITAALDVLNGVSTGTVAVQAAIELLTALGIASERAVAMVNSQAADAVPLLEDGRRLQLPARTLSSQLKELTNWRRKVAKSTPDCIFEPDELRGHPVADFVCERLDCRDDPDGVFWVARAWLETGQEPPTLRQAEFEPEPEDVAPSEATPEEYEAFWQHFDELRADIGLDWLAWMERLKRGRLTDIIKQAKEQRENPGASIDYGRFFEIDDELREAWLGTVGKPGPLTAVLFGGMAAGNDAMINNAPADYRSKVGTELGYHDLRWYLLRQAGLSIDWSLLSEEAYEFAKTYLFDLIKDINQVTVEKLQRLIADWLESGASISDLAESLEPIFRDKTRAELIAQTEGIRAYNVGARERYKDVGVTEARWKTVNVGRNRINKQEGDVCNICSPLHNLIGSLETGWVHPGGRGPENKYRGRTYDQPAHPRCRCFTQPILTAESLANLEI